MNKKVEIKQRLHQSLVVNNNMDGNFPRLSSDAETLKRYQEYLKSQRKKKLIKEEESELIHIDIQNPPDN